MVAGRLRLYHHLGNSVRHCFNSHSADRTDPTRQAVSLHKQPTGACALATFPQILLAISEKLPAISDSFPLRLLVIPQVEEHAKGAMDDALRGQLHKHACDYLTFSERACLRFLHLVREIACDVFIFSERLLAISRHFMRDCLRFQAQTSTAAG